MFHDKTCFVASELLTPVPASPSGGGRSGSGSPCRAASSASLASCWPASTSPTGRDRSGSASAAVSALATILEVVPSPDKVVSGCSALVRISLSRAGPVLG